MNYAHGLMIKDHFYSRYGFALIAPSKNAANNPYAALTKIS
jgi:hypothetical protein